MNKAVVAMVVMVACASWSPQASADEGAGHGPSKSGGLLSHNFQWAAHSYRPQLNVHAGLLQPLLFGGVNLALDLRLGRWVLEYSHGMFLDYTRISAIGERYVGDSGASLLSPWTTGGGLGYNLVDDLYVMVEAKVHRYETTLNAESVGYTTASIGPALAYRLFLWKGLNLTAYFRYWPNVWTSLESETVGLAGRRFQPVDSGLFANLSLGWSFDLF